MPVGPLKGLDRHERLRDERRAIQGRLRELGAVPLRVSDPEVLVDLFLDGLTEVHQLFEHGTM